MLDRLLVNIVLNAIKKDDGSMRSWHMAKFYYLAMQADGQDRDNIIKCLMLNVRECKEDKFKEDCNLVLSVRQEVGVINDICIDFQINQL